MLFNKDNKGEIHEKHNKTSLIDFTGDTFLTDPDYLDYTVALTNALNPTQVVFADVTKYTKN